MALHRHKRKTNKSKNPPGKTALKKRKKGPAVKKRRRTARAR